jgi:hypothetical protein
MRKLFLLSLGLIWSVLNSSHAQEAAVNNGNIYVHVNGAIGFFGDVSNEGPMVGLPSSRIYICGAVRQTIDGNVAINAFNCVVSNPTNVKLDNELSIARALHFMSGKIISDRNDMATEFVHFWDGSFYIGSDDTKHVDGVVRKTGDDTFVFPVGSKGNLQPVIISAPANPTDHFTAFYLQRDADTAYSEYLKDPAIHHISSEEFWMLDRTNGTSAVEVELTYDAVSGVVNQCELVVSRWDGTQWVNEGNGGTTGVATSGTVVSGTGTGLCGSPSTVSNFSPFTLGTTTNTNPLPVELLGFTAVPSGDNVFLNWTTASEINNAFFTVEKSMDAIHWEELFTVDGAGNSTVTLHYNGVDDNPYGGTSFYRLKQTDFDGTSSYSNIEVVHFKEEDQVVIYPNPTDAEIRIVNVQSSDNVYLVNAIGQQVQGIKPLQTINGELLYDLSSMASGLYFLVVGSESYRVVKN